MNLAVRSTLVLVGLSLVVVMLSSGSALAQKGNKDGVDDVDGTRWHYEIDMVRDKEHVEKGLFRVKDKVIYRNNKKVGEIHAQSATETTLIIDGLPELNGKATLKKVDEKPPVWRGHLVRKDGTKWKMKVEMKDK
jgi:hypothetical protein